MPKISVPWGHEQYDLDLPEDWQVEQVARPELRPAGGDWADRLARALTQPVSGPPLGRLLQARPNGRVVLVIEDMTRHSPVPEILDVVLREVRHARIADEQLEVVFAAGMHPPMTASEAAEKLGEHAHRLRWRSNPWQDRSAYVYVGDAGRLEVRIDRGVATADVRILISSVSPHLQAGFGGGYKMLVPGCAHIETIRGLHRLGLGRRARQLVGLGAESNAMRAAIEDAGRRIDDHHGVSFGVQFLLDADDQPTSVAAGEVPAAYQMVRKQCATACGVVTEGSADVVIANAHPRDFDLWQCFKSIPNTLWAARPGGVVICLARCEAGLHGMAVPPWPLSPTWTRRMLRLLGPEALSGLLPRLVPTLAGDAAFFVRLAAQTLARNPVMMVSPAMHAAGVRFPGLRVLAGMDDAVAEAERLLPEGRRRVVVFPAGGVTYPVPRRRNGQAAR